MSKLQEHPATRSTSQIWRMVGLFYLVILLVALAAGLWPESVYPHHYEPQSAPLTTLRATAVAQVAFILLIYPLSILGRLHRGTQPVASENYWKPVLTESAMFLLVGGIFYVPAAYLANATVFDTVRTALYIASLFPLSWVAGAYFIRRPRATAGVILLLVVIALGLPAAYYISLEFLKPGPNRWIEALSPALFAWKTSAPRLGTITPQPLWAWLTWPGIALLSLMFCVKRKNKTETGH